MLQGMIYIAYLCAILAAIFYGTGTAGMRIASLQGMKAWDLGIPYGAFLLVVSLVGKLAVGNSYPPTFGMNTGTFWTCLTGLLLSLGYIAVSVAFQIEKAHASIIVCLVALATPITVFCEQKFLNTVELDRPTYLLGLVLIVAGVMLVVLSKK